MIRVGGYEFVESGGIASGTVISSGEQVIYNGGTASGTVVEPAGVEYVSSGGRDINAILYNHQEVYSGASAFHAEIFGGQQDVFGTASSTTINQGVQYVEPGGVAIETIIYAGSQIVSTSGTAIGAVVSGGAQILERGTASGTIITSSGKEYVAGGIDQSAKISGGTQYDRGLASGDTIYDGGLQIVEIGGIASDTTVSGGGDQGEAVGEVVAGAAVELHPRAVLAGNKQKPSCLISCSHASPVGGCILSSRAATAGTCYGPVSNTGPVRTNAPHNLEKGRL